MYTYYSQEISEKFQHTATHCNTTWHILVFQSTVKIDCTADCWDISPRDFSEIFQEIFSRDFPEIFENSCSENLLSLKSACFSVFLKNDCRADFLPTFLKEISQNFNTLLHTATHRNTLQHTATHWNTQLMFRSTIENDCKANYWELSKKFSEFLIFIYTHIILRSQLVFWSTVESDCRADFGDISHRNSSTISSFEKFLILIYTHVILRSQLVFWSAGESDCRADYWDLSENKLSEISHFRAWYVRIYVSTRFLFYCRKWL